MFSEPVADAGIQLIILATLHLKNQAVVGIINTLCAAALARDAAKALDVVTEATIALSDVAESQILRVASLALCAICAVRFARGTEWWAAAEAMNSTADGVWAAAMIWDPSTADDSTLAAACRLALTAGAVFLLIDAFADLLR